MRFPLLVLTALALAACKPGAEAANGAQDQAAAPVVAIIAYDGTVAAAPDNILATAKQLGSEVIYKLENVKSVVVSGPPGKSFKDLEDAYGKLPGVLAVNKDQKLQLN